MSIPLLKQVHGEIRRLSIAGSAVAPGDFRLKKLVPGLEQAGKQAPVFAKIAQGIDKVLESNERSSAEALLVVSALLNAVLYTQGETDVPGDLSAIESVDLGAQQTRNSARVLKPLLEALTTTGSGRVETIKDAWERGVFRDLRLVGPALAAIDDPYPEIGDLISEKVLPLYGPAIIPELRERLDLGGRGGHVRRLTLLHRLDPKGTRELVKKALDEGSKEMKVAAIGCLGGLREDLAFLLEQIKARAADVRAAVLKALGRSPENDAVAALRAAFLGNDLSLAVEPVRASRSPQVLTFVIDEARKQWAAVTKEKDKEKQGKLVERMQLILECLRGRDDADTGKFLCEIFADRAKLAGIKSEPSGKDLQLRLIDVMAIGPKLAQDKLIAAHAELDEVEINDAFFAAVRSRSADEVFRLFSPYLAASVEGKKKRDPILLKRDAVAQTLAEGGSWRYHDLLTKLDSRWLDVALATGIPNVIHRLARPGHAATAKFLQAEFDEQFPKSKDAYDVSHVLGAMLETQHPSTPQALAAVIEKFAKGAVSYRVNWLIHRIPELPKSALPLFEALQTKLPEKVVDELIDALGEWKQRP